MPRAILYATGLILALGVIYVSLWLNETQAQEPVAEKVIDVGSGIYVFDIRETNAKDDIRGWAPLLRDFLEAHPELEVVAIAPAHCSGGRGTINSMLVYTRTK